MLIVPVLDLQGGVVVHGIAGRRREYRPIESRLTRSTAPLDVARAFRDQFGLHTLYVADLDAIAGQPPARAILDALRGDGFALWVDAGVRDLATVRQLQDMDTVIVGLETLPGPELLDAIAATMDRDRILVSLDMKDGRALTPVETWQRLGIEEIAAAVVARGFRRLLLLDLARVGVAQGTGTETLSETVRAKVGAEVSLCVGGGVRGIDDLVRLKGQGIAAVLVASALHDGKLTRGDLPLP
jgi:phosphoribosylformimino-5-aminoimidazole carboxamide ribotide isomerase